MVTARTCLPIGPFRSAAIDGGEVTLWVTTGLMHRSNSVVIRSPYRHAAGTPWQTRACFGSLEF
jgi:hypothetical protein